MSFTELTTSVGLDCTHVATAGEAGGIAVADFNNDGFPDLFILSGNGPDRLFINDGKGNFTDEAASWGLTQAHRGRGVSTADFNNDGWIDVYVTSLGPMTSSIGPGKHRLYRNNGGTSFTNIAASAGVLYTSYAIPGGRGSFWGDYDLDGDLDLFVTDWQGTSLDVEHNRLYRNNGDETFTDVTLAATGSLKTVWGFSGSFNDMNGDRWPELLISADFETSRYFINNGDGTFTDGTVAGGLGLDDNGMGQSVGDINNDLLPDWYVTSIFYDNPAPNINRGNMLYVNQGNDSYVEVSVAAGCNDGGWGWATEAADIDNDGWQDLIEVNSRAAPEWNNEQAYLFRNTTTVPGASPTFAEVAIACGFVHYANHTSMVAFDADSDGDLDIVSFESNGPLQYFENTTTGGNAWLQVDLDTSNNALLAPNGFGARIELTADGMSQVRLIDGRPTYLATGGTTAHFGLGGAAVISELRVEWPRGQDTVLLNVPVNQRLVITAPTLGDLNVDGVVNLFDLLDLLDNWGPCDPLPALCPNDLNNDRTINLFDLLLLLDNWG